MFRRYSEGVRNPNAMARDCRKMGIHRDTVRGGPGLLRQR